MTEEAKHSAQRWVSTEVEAQAPKYHTLTLAELREFVRQADELDLPDEVGLYFEHLSKHHQIENRYDARRMLAIHRVKLTETPA